MRKTIDDLPASRRNVDAGGFEDDAINFRRALATDDMPDGHFLEAPTRKLDNPVAPRLTQSEFKRPHQGSAAFGARLYLSWLCQKDEPPEPRSAAQAESDHRALQKIECAVSAVMAAIEDGLSRMDEHERQKVKITERLAQIPADTT